MCWRGTTCCSSDTWQVSRGVGVPGSGMSSPRRGAVVRREVFDTEKPQPALTAEQRRAFDASTRCPHCKHRYGSRRWSKAEEAMVAVEKVEDHDHRTGAFRSDLCNECNLTLGKLEKRQSRFVNFYFHNLKGYDMHHIIQALASDDTEFERMSCIPQNNEKRALFQQRLTGGWLKC